MERRVMITNMVNKKVGVKLAEYNINKRWDNKGQKLPIPFETVEQLLWHPGFRNMIDRGILYIESMQDKIDLGLESEDTKVPTKIKVLNDTQIIQLLTKASIEDFEKELKTLSGTQIREITNYAILNKITSNYDKLELLRKITGTDILAAISINQKVEEAEAKK